MSPPDAAVAPVPCPRCSGGQIVQRTSADARTFYACNQWPRCKFTSSYKPLLGKCPECSSPYLVARQMKSRHWVECPNKDCGWRPPVAREITQGP